MAWRRTLSIMQSFATLDLPRGTAVVCHDAGAANIVVAGLRASGRVDWRAVMQGPAAAIWTRAFGEPAPFGDVREALAGAPMLISGTGWASMLEHDARACARASGVPSVAVIDHWVNYQARFERGGQTVLPDAFWVTDEYSQAEARRVFGPQARIECVRNDYIEAQLRAIGAVTPTSAPTLLYVLEPARADWGKGRPGEFQALDYFAGRFSDLNLPAGVRILLRPHPSDPPGKYDDWLAANAQLRAALDTEPDIGVSIGHARWLAGCESFALVLGLLAGRQVICTLPPWAPACRLPHKGLIHMKDFESGST